MSHVLLGPLRQQGREGPLPTNTTGAGPNQEEPGEKDPVPELLFARAQLTLSLQQLGKRVLEGRESLSDACGAQTGANNSQAVTAVFLSDQTPQKPRE